MYQHHADKTSFQKFACYRLLFVMSLPEGEGVGFPLKVTYEYIRLPTTLKKSTHTNILITLMPDSTGSTLKKSTGTNILIYHSHARINRILDI